MYTLDSNGCVINVELSPRFDGKNRRYTKTVNIKNVANPFANLILFQ